MARPLRLSFENAVYHVTARGNRRENIFYSDRDKSIFLEKMNETFEKYSFICYGYCLMDNHYHLFIKTLLPNITYGMHYLNAAYANWFKAKHKIVGVVFQGRYKSILVDKDSYALGLSAYIHLNPIRAGIVPDIKEFKWSSFLDYTGTRRSIKRLDTEFILSQFDNNLSKAKKKYERFVLENINMTNPLEDAYKGIALGSETFIEGIKDKIKSIGKEREMAATRITGAHTAEEIIHEIMHKYEIKSDVIFRKQKGNMYRQLALYLLKKYTTLSLKEIGDFFKMDYAAVSQACKRFEEKTRIDKSVLNLKTAVEKARQGEGQVYTFD